MFPARTGQRAPASTRRGHSCICKGLCGHIEVIHPHKWPHDQAWEPFGQLCARIHLVYGRIRSLEEHTSYCTLIRDYMGLVEGHIPRLGGHVAVCAFAKEPHDGRVRVFFEFLVNRLGVFLTFINPKPLFILLLLSLLSF